MKPLLKWVGGKTQLLETLFSHFPSSMVNYFEPFLGGGSVLLELLTKQQNGLISIEGKIHASDINPVLIYFYTNIQKCPRRVIKELTQLKQMFDSCPEDGAVNRKAKNIEEACTSKESFYYYTRTVFNSLKKSTPKASAYFLFLNKTCWRGVYREGPNGFNVPYGHYVSPGIFDEKDILEVSKLIKEVEFTECSFSDALEKAKKGDFVYMDPPYVPIAKTSFVGYTTDGFDSTLHISLFELIESLVSRNVKIVMSNSNSPIIREALPEDKFEYITVSARRAIHSKNPSAKVQEVIVKGI